MKHNLVCYLQEGGVAFLFPLLHQCYLRPTFYLFREAMIPQQYQFVQ